MGNDNKGSGFFTGFILGGIIGAIAAFLLSQKSGKDTVKVKLKDLVDQGSKAIREAIEEGKEAAARKESEFHEDLKSKDK